MSAIILDGKATAETIRHEVASDLRTFVESTGQPVCLSAVLVGDDPASQVYVRNKERACQNAGFSSRIVRLPGSTSPAQLEDVIQQLNADSAVHGILVQLPLPVGLDTQRILDLVHPEKDVDCFSPENVGLLIQGRPRFLPCTPHGCAQLLKRYDIPVAGKHVVVVGRSEIVGKPIANMFLQRDYGLGPDWANASVTIVHSRSRDIGQFTRQADILVVAAGKPQLVHADMIRPGAIVLDVGINRVGDSLVGDVDFKSASQVAGAITPVPGGIGPLTIAMLLCNTLTAARLQMHRS